MNRAFRNAFLLASAIVAGGLTWLFGSRHLLTPEAPAYAVALMSVLAWVMWFIFLLPIWLPACVPNNWPRTVRVVSALSGLLLLSAVVAWAGMFFAFGGHPTWVTTAVALVIALVGVWHLARGFNQQFSVVRLHR